MAQEWSSRRVRVRRMPELGRYDRTSVEQALDREKVAHVAFVDDGLPYCMPMLYARSGDVVYVHGSTGSRAMRALARGVPACLTVTRLDGLVLARSVFEHTANYESVVLLGRFRPVEGADDRIAAFEALTERLLPGRWAEARHPNRKELSATLILALPIDEASVKLRTGGPDDDASADAALDIWAGVVPVIAAFGRPEASPGLREGIPVPESVANLLAGGARLSASRSPLRCGANMFIPGRRRKWPETRTGCPRDSTPPRRTPPASTTTGWAGRTTSAPTRTPRGP